MQKLSVSVVEDGRSGRLHIGWMDCQLITVGGVRKSSLGSCWETGCKWASSQRGDSDLVEFHFIYNLKSTEYLGLIRQLRSI